MDSPTAGTTTLKSNAFQTFSLVDESLTMTFGPAAGQSRLIIAHNPNPNARTVQVANFTPTPAIGDSFKVAFQLASVITRILRSIPTATCFLTSSGTRRSC